MIIRYRQSILDRQKQDMLTFLKSGKKSLTVFKFGGCKRTLIIPSLCNDHTLINIK